jgi:hypothetical protein
LAARAKHFGLARSSGPRTFAAMRIIHRPLSLLGLFAVLVVLATGLAAQEAPALVMENLGLKNTYRVVFEQFDEKNHFVTGALEILSDDDGREKPHTRIPFAADLKPDPKDKKSELLEIRCTANYFFFPPAEKKEPYPALTWKLTGRKLSKPVLKAKLWSFESEKESWMAGEMEFEKAGE